MTIIQRSVFEKSFSQEWGKFPEPQGLEKQIQVFEPPAFFYDNYPPEFEVRWASRDLSKVRLPTVRTPILMKAKGRGRFCVSLFADRTIPFCFSRNICSGGEAGVPEGMHVFDRHPLLSRSSCAASASPSDLSSSIGDAKRCGNDFLNEKPHLYL